MNNQTIQRILEIPSPRGGGKREIYYNCSMTKLIKWLHDHQTSSGGLISINALEKNVNAKRGTISHPLTGSRGLPERWIKPIEKEIKKYGYKP